MDRAVGVLAVARVMGGVGDGMAVARPNLPAIQPGQGGEQIVMGAQAG